LQNTSERQHAINLLFASQCPNFDRMPTTPRSRCPISLALDLIGDRWTLIILRDLIMRGRTRYQDLLDAEEGIATNVLADRLRRLEDAKVITKRRDPDNGKQFIYAPTEKGLDLLPVLFDLMHWSSKHDKRTDQSIPFLKRLRSNESALRRDILKRFAADSTPTR
jgi:DNA-binding HxlR family transcriptional regulator